MTGNVDEDNMNNYGPSDDRARIVPGQEDSDEEILDAELAPTPIDRGNAEGEESVPTQPARKIPTRVIFTVLSLSLVNLLNYMDRFTVAGK